MQNFIKFYLFVHKILSGNKISTLTKGHNCVVNLKKKMMRNNPNLVWLRSKHMQNLIKFHGLVHKILSRNEILTLSKGHNYVVNLQKWTRNNPNFDLVKINAYAKFDQILSMRS